MFKTIVATQHNFKIKKGKKIFFSSIFPTTERVTDLGKLNLLTVVPF